MLEEVTGLALLTWVAWIATEAQAHSCKSVKDDQVQLGMYLLVQPTYDKYINTYIRFVLKSNRDYSN